MATSVIWFHNRRAQGIDESIGPSADPADYFYSDKMQYMGKSAPSGAPPPPREKKEKGKKRLDRIESVARMRLCS